MENETIKGFYQERELQLTTDLGNFNVATINDSSICSIQPIPFIRRNYYKISILQGKYKIHYADKTYTIKKQALLFANPSIPYNWIPQEGSHNAIYCVFTPEFFHQFGDINSYSVFQPNGAHVVELDDVQYQEIEKAFKKMEIEFASNYSHKFDLLKNLVFEVLHFASKLSHQSTDYKNHSDSAKRVTDAFLELLERQFPIESKNQQLLLTSPADFADKLSLHVNYLNRVLKKTMGSPTSKIIQERILREAKILLKHSTLSISEISYLLSFKETTHFSNFFKKTEGVNPSDYRKV